MPLQKISFLIICLTNLFVLSYGYYILGAEPTMALSCISSENKTPSSRNCSQINWRNLSQVNMENITKEDIESFVNHYSNKPQNTLELFLSNSSAVIKNTMITLIDKINQIEEWNKPLEQNTIFINNYKVFAKMIVFNILLNSIKSEPSTIDSLASKNKSQKETILYLEIFGGLVFASTCILLWLCYTQHTMMNTFLAEHDCFPKKLHF